MKHLQKYLSEHKLLSISLAIFWTIGIFIGCSMPGRDLPSINVFDHFDKVVHFSFFLVFFILWNLSTANFKHKILLLVLVTAVYGFAIEFYQLNFVPGRSFDVWDGVADTLGAVFGAFIISKSGQNELKK